MIGRTKVLWVGEAPESQIVLEFRNRNLSVEAVGDGGVSAITFAQSCGIVYRFSSSTLTATRKFFAQTISAASDHGLYVYLLADDDTIQSHISGFIGDYKIELRRRTAPVAAHELPEAIARHEPGPGYNDALEIKLDDGTQALTPEETVLLKRAFGDCIRISLRPLVGGLSANVFVAYAIFRDSLVGPRPLPFFVKIDDRLKIAKERSNYQLYASHFIPFNLRPNLDLLRCIEASKSGVLVGNFVDRSESLWDVVRRGQGQAAIHSLFEEALRGWWIQAFCEPPTIIERPVAAGLGGAKAFDYSRVRDSHLAFAKNFGILAAPIELWESLIGLKEQKYRAAPIHGDLHGKNVRVRGGDAIVIDLASITTGPLVADLAALETWLAFELPPTSSGDRRDDDVERDEWQRIVDKLYAPAVFAAVPPPATELFELEWLWTCVRQLRAMVDPIQLCETEYQSAVAVYLLRRTMWEGVDVADSYRRGYAYVLAARLIDDLVSREKAKCAPAT
jgi:hypothetical protein